MDMCGVEDSLFDLPQEKIKPGDQVVITMPWGDVWTCEVQLRTWVGGWPALELRHGSSVFTVDSARCKLAE